MAVITLATTKGGSGKTTAVLAIAADLAAAGLSTLILDADPNQHAARIGAKIAKRVDRDQLRIRGGLTEANILAEIKKARAEATYVFLDLPGVSSKLTLLALTRSDLAVIPVQPSDMDINDALATLEGVRQAAEAAERRVPACFLLSRWPVSIESRAAKQTRKRLALKAPDTPILRTPLMQRTALAEMSFNGYAPCLAEPEGNAAANVRAVRDDILEHLKREGDAP